MIKKLFALFAALLATPLAASPAGDSVRDYRAMTYNIRLDLASDKADAWPNRREKVSSLIAFYRPDFFGTQEVLLHQKQALEEDLPDYAFIGVARDDGKEAGEFSPLAYRTDRFILRDSGTFWLSPTPDEPSKGWDAALPRVASWARMQDRETGAILLVLNTHFDHMGAIAREESAKLIRRWITEHVQGEERVIAMGDFNSDPDSAPFHAMTAESVGDVPMVDTYVISQTGHFGPSGTFTGFRIDRQGDVPIDHIFVGPGIAVLRHATISQQDKGRLPSDHYPVIADLRLQWEP